MPDRHRLQFYYRPSDLIGATRILGFVNNYITRLQEKLIPSLGNTWNTVLNNYFPRILVNSSDILGIPEGSFPRILNNRFFNARRLYFQGILFYLFVRRILFGRFGVVLTVDYSCFPARTPVDNLRSTGRGVEPTEIIGKPCQKEGITGNHNRRD